jgi:hypothetical protein
MKNNTKNKNAKMHTINFGQNIDQKSEQKF